MKLTRFLPTLFTVIIISIAFVFVALPVLHDGFFHVYDNVHVTRLMAFSGELASGQFPVRYLDSFGHGAGYFLFTFYSPLIYYLGSLFHLIGFSYIQSLKLVYLLFLLVGTTGIYTLLRSLVGKFASTLGTLSFLLAPYLYHVFFHRGTITEAAAMMLIPWLIWAFIRLKESSSRTNLVLCALVIALSILTHTLTAVMAILAAVLYFALPPYKTSSLLSALASLALGIGLSASFLIPSVTSSRLVQYTSNSLVERGYLDHPVSFVKQAFAMGDGTEKSAFLGLTLVIGFLLTIALTLKSSKFRKKYSSVLTLSLLVTVLGFFIMSPASSQIWSSIIYLRYVQFPFRFLTIVTVFAVILYSLLLEHFSDSKPARTFLTLIVFLPLFISPQFHKPLGYQYTTDYKVEDPCMTASWADEHLPIWVKECLLKPRANLVEPLSSKITLNEVHSTNNGRLITINTSGSGDILVSKYYFPGWVATNKGGKSIPLSPQGKNGLIKIQVSESDVPFTLELRETKLEELANLLSIISLLMAVILIYSAYAKNK